MTAVSLFDALSRDDGPSLPTQAGGGPSLVELAERLIASSLSDLSRIGEFEKRFAITDENADPSAHLAVIRSVWRMYKDWADEAEQVLTRARTVANAGVVAAQIDQLDDAIGRTLARLSVTPEALARAKRDAREGRTIPAGELRDELHARLRAGR